MTPPETPSNYFFSEDQPPASPYWESRRALATAARDFQEALCTSDIEPDDAQRLIQLLQTEAATLRQRPQHRGTVALAQAATRGSQAVINHELLAVGGKSHSAAPDI